MPRALKNRKKDQLVVLPKWWCLYEFHIFDVKSNVNTCFERKICFIFFFTYSFQAVSEMFLTIFQLFVKMIFISKRCKHKHLSYSFHLQNSQHQFVCTNFMTNWLLCLINPIQKNYFQVRISVCVFILALRSGWTWFYIYVLFPI